MILTGLSSDYKPVVNIKEQELNEDEPFLTMPFPLIEPFRTLKTLMQLLMSNGDIISNFNRTIIPHKKLNAANVFIHVTLILSHYIQRCQIKYETNKHIVFILMYFIVYNL